MGTLFKIILILFIIIGKANANDDFGDYEELDNTKKVSLSDSSFSKSISIYTIKGNIVVNKILRPFIKLYINTTTDNFRLSLNDALATISNTESVLNGVLVFSPKITLSNFGYLTTNIVTGFGVTNVAKEFELKHVNISFTDVFRFYGLPELYFATAGLMPLTFTTTLGTVASILQPRFLLFAGGFGVDFVTRYINTYSLNLAAFDILSKTNPEVIYETLKNKTYSDVKRFKIDRGSIHSKKRVLKEYIDLKN